MMTLPKARVWLKSQGGEEARAAAKQYVKQVFEKEADADGGDQHGDFRGLTQRTIGDPVNQHTKQAAQPEGQENGYPEG